MKRHGFRRVLVVSTVVAAVLGAMVLSGPAASAGAAPGRHQSIHIEWVAEVDPCLVELTYVDANRPPGQPATADFRLIRTYRGGTPSCPGDDATVFFAQGELSNVAMAVTSGSQLGFLWATGSISCPEPACPSPDQPVAVVAGVRHNPEQPIGEFSAIAHGVAVVDHRVTAAGASDPQETSMSSIPAP